MIFFLLSHFSRKTFPQESFQDCVKRCWTVPHLEKSFSLGPRNSLASAGHQLQTANTRMAHVPAYSLDGLGFHTFSATQPANLRFASQNGTRFTRARHAKYDYRLSVLTFRNNNDVCFNFLVNTARNNRQLQKK